MSSSKHLRIAILAVVIVVTVGGLWLVWPSYREAKALNHQAALLRNKGEGYSIQLEVIDRFTADLDEMTRRVETQHKVIPESPDIAGLMRVLSMPVDGVTIRDQTFTTGQPKEAVVGGDLTAMATPLTIDMVARFDSIFALIQAAESLDRLLRVESLNIVCEHPEGEDELFVTASVSLDVIYDPPGTREDR
ncbi:MAG: type 4a pilus biogenesis protein PilO [Planctomycetes bacterium]|nr:type 4a pilus biogenesis protein PilO [Planctomycetota bacterium]